MIFSNPPLLESDLHFMVLGEKMQEGLMLYRDIFDPTEPFSALVFAAINGFFGRSILAFYIFSFLITLYMVLYFGWMAKDVHLFKEKNWVSSFVFLLVMHVFFDFYTLSPAMLGLAFVLPGMHYYFLVIKGNTKDSTMFNTGLFFSIAFLFHYSTLIYFILAFFGFFLFGTVDIRKVLLYVWGFLFPLILVVFFFYWQDGAASFFDVLFSVTYKGFFKINSTESLLIFILPTLTLSMLSFFLLASSSGFVNHQILNQQAMMISIPFGIVALYFLPNHYVSNLLIFIPPIVFFLTHFFQLVQRPFVVNSLSIAYGIYIFAVIYQWNGGLSADEKNINFNKQMVQKATDQEKWIANKRILVLDDRFYLYGHNRLATPFLNWKKSKEVFDHLNSYSNLLLVYTCLLQDPPDMIVGNQTVLNQLFYHIPQLKNQYTLGKIVGSYVRIESPKKALL